MGGKRRKGRLQGAIWGGKWAGMGKTVQVLRAAGASHEFKRVGAKLKGGEIIKSRREGRRPVTCRIVGGWGRVLRGAAKRFKEGRQPAFRSATENKWGGGGSRSSVCVCESGYGPVTCHSASSDLRGADALPPARSSSCPRGAVHWLESMEHYWFLVDCEFIYTANAKLTPWKYSQWRCTYNIIGYNLFAPCSFN